MDSSGSAELPGGRGGWTPAGELMSAVDMSLPQPDLSAAGVDQTRALFEEFLAHLDRLGLAEPATHVSLAFERFLSMYPANRAGD